MPIPILVAAVGIGFGLLIKACSPDDPPPPLPTQPEDTDKDSKEIPDAEPADTCRSRSCEPKDTKNDKDADGDGYDDDLADYIAMEEAYNEIIDGFSLDGPKDTEDVPDNDVPDDAPTLEAEADVEADAEIEQEINQCQIDPTGEDCDVYQPPDGDIFGETDDGQLDSDGDGVPDTTDTCPQNYDSTNTDTDKDGVGDVCDNCPKDPNPDQTNICAPPKCDKETFPELGEPCTAIEGACLMYDGVIVCDESGTSTTCFAVPGNEVPCDNWDNDCDDQIDEGYKPGDVCQAIYNACTFIGVNICSENQEYVCDISQSIPPAGTKDYCDGKDDDCDGQEGEDTPEITCGEGICQTTIQGCVNGKPNTCTPLPISKPEECNGQDDDCDGDIDEDLPEQTCGLGQCKHNETSCDNGYQKTCNPMQGATEEICDGNDNDCDGKADEDLGTMTCNEGMTCESVVPKCINGKPAECPPPSGGVEMCNGVDDDCDLQIDEDMGTIACGIGACLNTVPMCFEGKPNSCEPLPPSEEVACNNIDDNCDGYPDNQPNITNQYLVIVIAGGLTLADLKPGTNYKATLTTSDKKSAVGITACHLQLQPCPVTDFLIPLCGEIDLVSNAANGNTITNAWDISKPGVNVGIFRVPKVSPTTSSIYLDTGDCSLSYTSSPTACGF